MSEQSARLADKLAAFNEEVIAVVEQCSDDDWKKACSEDWPVGVVARHIGVSHYGAVVELTKMIVAGQPLPDFTPEALVQMANDHAREHANCTKQEVLTALRDNGANLKAYAAGLNDDELNRTTHMELLGGEVSAEQFLEAIILQSAGEHFTSMKTALGKT